LPHYGTPLGRIKIRIDKTIFSTKYLHRHSLPLLIN
jgi:hypothetical protein